MSIDGEEVQEEVAEAVQSARKERLRDDLLGMVCPSNWTIQAPEPPGMQDVMMLLVTMINMPLLLPDVHHCQASPFIKLDNA